MGDNFIYIPQIPSRRKQYGVNTHAPLHKFVHIFVSLSMCLVKFLLCNCWLYRFDRNKVVIQ